MVPAWRAEPRKRPVDASQSTGRVRGKARPSGTEPAEKYKEFSMLRILSIAALLLTAMPVAAADIKILLPLGRTAYQTNEWIDISVVRSDAQPLPAGTLTIALRPLSF